MFKTRIAHALLCAITLLFVGSAHAVAAPLKFSVTYDNKVDTSFTGRVYVMMSERGREPRFGPSWFGTEPFYAKDVKDWKPGDALIFDDTALSFPTPLSQLPAKNFAVQAVMRRSLDSPHIGDGEGTAYSTSKKFDLDGGASGTIELVIDQVVEKRFQFPKRGYVHKVTMRSQLLSAFHGRDIFMHAAVITPAEDIQPGPALYHIPGFGGDIMMAFQISRPHAATEEAKRIVNIVLDPTCYGGHDVFADSANNGPYGEALTKEFIPYIEKEFGLTSQPWARFVTGHSSGGWSSLWLQVTYPDFFGGVWSTSPDPVDFRDFQRINLYEPGANMYVDEHGQRRPLARQTTNGEDHVMIWYDDFAKMEWVMGDGGQLGSFEWVFSPRGADGQPRRLFDRTTGAVDHDVAETWKKYDIRMTLEDHWKTLGPKLKGKLHVYMGDVDTFYLDGAVRLLKDSLAKLGSDAVVEMYPGKDHGTILTSDLRDRIEAEVMQAFDAGQSAAAKNEAPAHADEPAMAH